jgi:hemerythrin-like domain-containing protein
MRHTSRRRFMACVGVGGLGALAAGCSKTEPDESVTAVEDLMREHGVLRRALLVYEETARRLRTGETAEEAIALEKTARLFRRFGEDYHERALEEAYIFPALTKADPSMSDLVDTLIRQHERGRQVTDFMLAATEAPQFLVDRAMEAAGVLETFVLMYQNHAAREDTVVFPAWKGAVSPAELADMGEKFEEIERKQFGEDGFELAVTQVREIEEALGLADLSRFTPPPPPEE